MTMQVPGYLIQRELGRGGMGMVFLAIDQKTDIQVALKILPPHLVTPVTARRFQREGRALQAIRHPHIVAVHDVGARDGNHFISMEYVKGAPLSKTLRSHPSGLPLELARSYGGEIASALQCIHERGMTHRDLKPGNVMLTEEGHTKLLDFGLVQVDGLTMLTATGNIVGTPRYMSPEQCEGTALDFRSDIYSFGILIYEMLTGRTPFQSDSMYDLLEMQKTGAAEPPSRLNPTLPHDIEQMVLRCLEKDPRHRPQSMREVLEVLNPQGAAALDGPRESHGSPVPKASVRRSSKRRLPVRTGVYLLLVGAIGLFSVFITSSSPKAEALRGRFISWLPEQKQQDSTLRQRVRKRFQALTEAEGLFQRATQERTRGNDEYAFELFTEAYETYPEEPKYLRALIDLSGLLDRRSETRKIVQAYLRQEGAKDPGGLFAQWLETEER